MTTDHEGKKGDAKAVGQNDEIEEFVGQLDKITYRLRRDGNSIVLATMVNLFAAIVAALASFSNFRTLVFGSTTLVATLSLVFLLLSATLVFRFQREARSGELIEEEISDELQWRLKKRTMRIDDDEPYPRTPLDVRISLRRFSSSSRLPMASRRGYLPIYILANLAITALAIVLNILVG